jgi:hypothetical protein
LIACSKSEGDNSTAPEISYDQTTLQAAFYQEGQLAAPMIDWNGDPGQFGLESTIKGVSINPQSGSISWDKTLPLGVNDITVLAFNNSGTTSTIIQIDNRFSGKFQGFFGTVILLGPDPIPMTFMFKADGGSTFNPGFDEPLEGSWEIDENMLEAQYHPIDNPENHQFLKGAVIYTSTEAYVEGSFGTDPEDPEKSDGFRVDLIID